MSGGIRIWLWGNYTVVVRLQTRSVLLARFTKQRYITRQTPKVLTARAVDNM